MCQLSKKQYKLSTWKKPIKQVTKIEVLQLMFPILISKEWKAWIIEDNCSQLTHINRYQRWLQYLFLIVYDYCKWSKKIMWMANKQARCLFRLSETISSCLSLVVLFWCFLSLRKRVKWWNYCLLNFNLFIILFLSLLYNILRSINSIPILSSHYYLLQILFL